MKRTWRSRLLACASLCAIAPLAWAAPPTLGPNDDATSTPIKHVIVIYGENRSFDHVFATYTSPSGDSVLNLLSEGIINADGSPGPKFSQAAQWKADANNKSGDVKYSIAPKRP